ncbi:TetR family transcriptional regulator [Nocardia seriolae]|uniref:TetR/AcrR family transcriptional regulator n=1 Tax=Nocardia seriolae TaxID=37332 RepID=UPI0012BD1822|nr:TetR/AcrR family transcriptional regulator [Nocardia seriolae]MTL16759.1 TetR family transcriptional regulator [Nocardia seriolae]
MAATKRDRMIDAAIDALRTKGVAGMSFTAVLDASGAARGAIYHHFPGGKTELVATAAARNGEQVRDLLAALPAPDPLTLVEAFLTLVRPVVAASAEGAGCAVAAVTVDPDSGDLRTVAATAFDSWTTTLAERLTAAGVEPAAAADLATTLLTLLEGAHVLCRAEGTIAPFDRMSRAATDLVWHRFAA